ncbi:MAG TPA: metallophosphoesterase [Propionibacteriaceae bacterium]|jgi:predicted phosphodiesterase|nr:metallophosphoesterase [Propionibacteriaceae bacterium]
MNDPASGRWPFRPGADRPRAPRNGRGPAESGQRRTLTSALARHAVRVRSNRALLASVGKALLLTLLAALAAAPLAVVWGISHAQVDDYLGPHRVNFASNFRGEIELNLGPIGNAYLDSPVRPIGLLITVGGVDTPAGSLNSLFSEQTLIAYTSLYTEPEEALSGIVERLAGDAVREGLKAEAALLLGIAIWQLRRQLVPSWTATRITRRRAAAIYLTVVALVIGSILVPERPKYARYPVAVADGGRFSSLTVDSVLLADVLDRGIEGIRLLSERQQRAVQTYIGSAAASLSGQLDAVPSPTSDETMILGFSDLHCNQAMTELIGRLAHVTKPSLVLSSGDDTVNGTAAERGCVRREANIPPAVPFLVATGNHDSDVTEAQMRNVGMTVLDGQVVEAAGLGVLGDDDPEHNIPFSVDRVKDRPESEEEMAQRLIDVARDKPTDVLLVHQPVAARVIMNSPNPPAPLVLWGHYHAQSGPRVIMHDDGSWTVGMQQGTAGGVREPTFTSFSTPFSPPLISADVYFYFRDNATGLITGVQPVHFRPDAKVVIEDRIPTGALSELPPETRMKLDTTSPTPSTEASR